MKKFNQYLNICPKTIDMFNLDVEFYDFHNDVSFDDVIVIPFTYEDIPLSNWNNDNFLEFINNIKAGKSCKFIYGDIEYFNFDNGIFTYSVNSCGALSEKCHLIFEPEYISCLIKMHNVIEQYIQSINNRKNCN